MRYLVEHQLQRNGFEVILAKDGPGGLQAAQEHKPDLVVLDLMMPGMDGFEVCRKIRQDPLLARVPIIFLTSSVTKEDKLRAFELGADDYLTKPFHADEFLAHVTAVLRRTGDLSQDKKEELSGRIAALYSPKGGVGTTTLAVQLSETMVLHEGRPIVLIDLDLPLGGIAPMLSLYTDRNVVGLLKYPPEHFNLSFIQGFAQRHRSSLLVIPAPGEFIQPQQ
jgi:DNA-binding response OmpR family regulator